MVKGRQNTTEDRQTNSLTPYTGVCRFFLSVKFATFLLTSLVGGKLSWGKVCVALHYI